ncbi:MAG: 50S ribosomal protein L10 [Candidatus Moranbacteria bacterium RIFOXYA12_FULL_35_19]|nr:MAG: 50S ribosomal protein L10 [Candidatus Moranbacteria bacterium GW2011_GWF2_35_39]OGI30129.1 MAG: 50S ribosomal protein L10 [Candidatus Moranbacteria bacterium RIFOXYB12_FULL_35_8]OGI33189.1 MAG: 50S ribosomal protein L10 [Candidatus Moranbacteria bacterium RIFOXYC12_FULL_36_13]OGI36649.1 MAG: 50S ribosomal protein L10 [Candidatus Moranbacteria bacterium RIFOXYA12_FULL_35_19]
MQTKLQKKEIVKDLAQKIKNSKAVVFSDFKGLSVKDMTILRSELREKNIDFKVLKKTLMTLALKDAGIEMDAKKMEGQIAVAVSSGDEVEASKIIAKMAKANENLKISGGILGKKILSKEEVMALSKLPSKEELLAKLVGTLNAPVSGFVNVLAGNLRGLVQVLKSISEVKV